MACMAKKEFISLAHKEKHSEIVLIDSNITAMIYFVSPICVKYIPNHIELKIKRKKTIYIHFCAFKLSAIQRTSTENGIRIY